MNEALTQNLVQWGADLLIALLGLLCAYAVAYMRKGAARLVAETESIKNNTAASSLSSAINQVDDLAERTVGKFEQIVAGELRKSVKDGKVNREELLSIGKQAVDEVMSMIGPEISVILFQHLGDVRTFVENTIEKKVLDLKSPVQPTSLQINLVPASPVVSADSNSVEPTDPPNGVQGNTIAAPVEGAVDEQRPT